MGGVRKWDEEKTERSGNEMDGREEGVGNGEREGKWMRMAENRQGQREEGNK